MLARVAAIAPFPVFSKWAFAGEQVHSEAGPAHSGPYQPQFFTPAEYRTLDVLCELIIPADESPGAHDAGVSEFIDFMTSRDEDLQYPFRTGLAWLNAFATEKQGKPFVDLPPAAQEALLNALLDDADAASSNKLEGREFFSLARKYTVIGYYTSRIGLEELAYPGLRFYSASPECPHKDDPEHKHLAAGK